MQGVILAAGKGSRLHPITIDRSKAMLPVLGKPIVERVLELLLINGIHDFILVVSPSDRDITRYFSRESSIEADIRFVYQPERKGMADALACAAPLITEDFVLSACDNLVPSFAVERLVAMMRGEASEMEGASPNGVLTLMPVDAERLGTMAIVEMDGPWITRIVEKAKPGEVRSNMSSLPLYALSRRIIDYLPDVPLSPRGEYELQDAIQMLIEHDGRVGGLVIDRRLTLTNAADLLALNREYLMHGDDRPQLAPSAVGPGTQLITPLHIGARVVIGKDCTVGPNVYIERNCRLGDGVTVHDAILLRGAEVPDGTTVVNEVVA
jgi:UDP-N-acetylglucosamine diphosphorylase / glucose-1-phosphate thymidylyltransferase / UDP-N-acetylgalactosamine diphosphorylase / glucosamine-1-phosphate N-acetyltransferase / galactosamine-1-phosphate N-acetyltransferase